jgi:hypothetical protein
LSLEKENLGEALFRGDKRGREGGRNGDDERKREGMIFFIFVMFLWDCVLYFILYVSVLL